MTPASSTRGQARRHFTEEDARNLIGRRVQARVALSRHWLRDLGLWIGSGSLGTVTQFAFGPEPDKFLVGVYWDDPRPSPSAPAGYSPAHGRAPKRQRYPIDWYTEDEYRALLGVPAQEAA